MINLRDYQIEAISIIKNKFKDWDRQYVEMPTGSGKTITFLSYAKENHKKILVVVPSKELMRQVYESALLFYSKNEISRKGDQYDENVKTLHICIINSIRQQYLDFISTVNFDLLVIDEAHRAQGESYKKLIKKLFEHHELKILGATATPDRADGQLLSSILGSCSFKIEIEYLIEKKHLSDIEGYSVKSKIDISHIDDHNGDFSVSQLYKKLSTESRNDLIVDICKKEMTDRKNLIFCINLQHSKEICKLLNSRGISSMHIDGSMNSVERSSILSAFRNGSISCLCNCQILTEGFDEPSIDGIILARPTRSRALFAQMIGRGLRIFPGKNNCKIIDIVDGHRQLAGFNNLLTDHTYPELSEFKSIKDIRKNIGIQMLQVTEFKIERVNIFNSCPLDDLTATDCMIEYLEENEIYFQHPISFDEASFLIWHDKLKKEYAHGSI